MPSKIRFWKQMRGLLSTIRASAGLMPTQNLGTGTANSTTVLRGDQAYAKVSLAMQDNMATASVVYRKSAGAGIPQVQTLATLKTDLDLTGTNSGDITINSLVTTTYTIDVGTSGTDVNVSSAGSTVTVNIPDASPTARGVVTTGMQEFIGLKRFERLQMIGASDVPQMDVTPWVSQTANQQVWRNTAGAQAAFVDAAGRMVLGNNSFTVSSTFNATMWSGGAYGWAATSVNSTAAIDTGLYRDGAAGIIGSRFSTTAHLHRIYNTYTNASNYERGLVGFVGGVFTIGTEAAGTGTLRDIRLGLSGNKIGFFGTTSIVRPTTGGAAATFTANAGTTVNDASTFDGYTIREVVAALRALGLLT